MTSKSITRFFNSGTPDPVFEDINILDQTLEMRVTQRDY